MKSVNTRITGLWQVFKHFKQNGLNCANFICIGMYVQKIQYNHHVGKSLLLLNVVSYTL